MQNEWFHDVVDLGLGVPMQSRNGRLIVLGADTEHPVLVGKAGYGSCWNIKTRPTQARDARKSITQAARKPLGLGLDVPV